jgi:endonuclease YncB( thermonuclease family)
VTRGALLLLLLLALPASAHENKFPAIITGVIDGDTVQAQLLLYRFDANTVSSLSSRVRLAGIAAREKNTEAGMNAKAALTNRAVSQLVTIEVLGRDKYGRLLGILWLKGDPESLNDWLVTQGFAIHCGKAPQPACSMGAGT